MIGLIGNFEKPATRAAVLRASKLIAKGGGQVATDSATAPFTTGKKSVFPSVMEMARHCELVVVFGGDGTMLRVIAELDGLATPILGINVGRLGFLTAVSSKDLPAAFKKIWQKDYTIEQRPLLEATGECEGKPRKCIAFNDIVISKGAVSRIIELNVAIDKVHMTCYRGDGLIVCSPTGSTAYSLSAGGPIISPDANVFAITPICAHAVSNRSVIVSADSTIRVQLLSRQLETFIATDGQVQGNLGADDAIIIRRSSHAARLIRLGGSSFFNALRQKLHWSGSSV